MGVYQSLASSYKLKWWDTFTGNIKHDSWQHNMDGPGIAQISLSLWHQYQGVEWLYSKHGHWTLVKCNNVVADRETCLQWLDTTTYKVRYSLSFNPYRLWQMTMFWRFQRCDNSDTSRVCVCFRVKCTHYIVQAVLSEWRGMPESSVSCSDNRDGLNWTFLQVTFCLCHLGCCYKLHTGWTELSTGSDEEGWRSNQFLFIWWGIRVTQVLE